MAISRARALPWKSVTVVFGAALVAFGAARIGAADGATVTYSGCENLATGVIRMLTAPDGSALTLAIPFNKCLDSSNTAAAPLLAANPKLREMAITWNQQGPQGQPGSQGPAGPQGQPGAFNGDFTSPNGAYRISVTDNGIVLSGPGAEVDLTSSGTVVKGNDVVVDANGGVTVTGGHHIRIESGDLLEVRGTLIGITSSSATSIQGAIVTLNGSCSAIATAGSPVVVDATGFGTVVSGSTTVLTC